MSEDLISDVAKLLKVLSDRTQLRIFRLLKECGEMDAATLCRRLRLSIATVNRHLAVMSTADVIESDRGNGEELYWVNWKRYQNRLQELLSTLFTSRPNATDNQPDDWQADRRAGFV